MKSKSITWHSEKRKISQLKEWDKNPRKASEKQTSDLTRSIDKFNLAEPIIINTDDVIVGGHFRLKVLKQKGIKEIDVRLPDRRLNAAEIKELNIRLNKNTGDWDFDKLEEFFSVKELGDWGFKDEELEFLDEVEVKEDDFDVEKEYKKITKPKTKLGDIYELGGHKLICHYSESEDAYKALISKNKPRLIFTDPPYNVDYKSPAGNSYNSGKYAGSSDKVFNDNKKPDECLKFYTDVLNNIYKYTSDDASIYWWFANNNYHINREAFINSSWHLSQILIWIKEHFVFSRGQDYHRCYEPVMYGWKKGQKHYRNNKYGNLKDVFSVDFEDFTSMLDTWFIRRDNTNEYLHPTQKPVRLAERAIKRNTTVNDIIIDAFAGSGFVLIACEQLHRNCYLIELDPKYCDVIIKRYIKFRKDSGKECKIFKNGKSMNIQQFNKAA